MFSDPQRNIEQFELTEGMSVADLGAGSGFYSISAARVVGDGKVYAVDVQRDLLTKLSGDAQKSHLTNIEVIWGDAEKSGGTKLGNDSMDAVIISNILFQLQDKGG